MPCNIAGLISNVSQKVPPKSPKIAVVDVDNLTVIWRPRPEEPAGISAYALYYRKLVI